MARLDIAAASHTEVRHPAEEHKMSSTTPNPALSTNQARSPPSYR